MDLAHIVVLAGLAIGLIYGAVGLVSGFCLMSSLRGWWADGDGRLVRTYALAMGTGVVASQLLATFDLVDLGKSIYLQPTFSAPLMFLGGVLFGYGMVMSNGCGSRALVLLGRGNLRSFVVVIVLGIVAEMTLKGLIAPVRVALLQASQRTAAATSLPALLSSVASRDQRRACCRPWRSVLRSSSSLSRTCRSAARRARSWRDSRSDFWSP